MVFLWTEPWRTKPYPERSNVIKWKIPPGRNRFFLLNLAKCLRMGLSQNHNQHDRPSEPVPLLLDLPDLLCVCMLSCFSRVWLLVTLWTVAHQAPLSMGFSRQEYWSGLPCLPPGDLPESLMSPSLAGRFFTTSATREAHPFIIFYF